MRVSGSKRGSIWVRLVRHGLAVFLLTLSVTGAKVVWAQVLYGTVTGEVTDQTGADIPNATVTLTNQANGLTRSTTTGSPRCTAAPDCTSVSG